MHGGTAFTPFDPAFQRDPYPFYRRLREADPACYVDHNGWGFFFLTRHADVSAALRDPRLGRAPSRPSEAYLASVPEGYRPVLRLINDWMLLRDPPDHTRLRSLVNRAFTPRVVENLRPRVRQIADELLDRVAGQGEMDLIADLAFPLPVIVIAELLGIPPADRELFRRWSNVLVENIDLNQSDASLRAGSLVAGELSDYLRAMIADRRRAPRDDLLSGLVAAEERGDRLSEAELIANCALLLAAGHETTVNLIGNGVLALLRAPGEWARLGAEPGLLPNAVEELLRYESPVQLTFRDALEELELHGRRVCPGQQVCLALGAANRDPAAFAEPDVLDVARPEAGRHLAFAAGIHYCVGAALARTEGQVALERLLARAPGLRLAEPDPPLRDTVALRGRSRVRVAW